MWAHHWGMETGFHLPYPVAAFIPILLYNLETLTYKILIRHTCRGHACASLCLPVLYVPVLDDSLMRLIGLGFVG